MKEPLTLKQIKKEDIGVYSDSLDELIEISCIEMDISLAMTYCKHTEAFEITRTALQRAAR